MAQKKLFTRQWWLYIVVALLGVALIGCAEGAPVAGQPDSPEDSEAAVIALVQSFGQKLREVSLLAPEDTLKDDMLKAYGDMVSPSLIDSWAADPLDAPGRSISSPWPDRIELLDAKEVDSKHFSVTGRIIEITSTEEQNGGIAAARPITLLVTKGENGWLIDDVVMGEYEVSATVEYRNSEYGLSALLPKTWAGFSIVDDEWTGLPLDGEGGAGNAGDASDASNVGDAIKGPTILIRHPAWTEENPRQDIPIMVLTLEQWESLGRDEFNIGAAPMNPTELGRNGKYVFALPARYNYAFLEGYEEVDALLTGGIIRGFDVP